MRAFWMGLFLAAVTLPAGASPATRSPLFHEAVVNGQPVAETDLVWRSTVYLTIQYETQTEIRTSICTGAILDTDFILTAAHCLPTKDAQVKIHFIKGNKTVVATRDADEFRIHRDYRPEDENLSPAEKERLEEAKRVGGSNREISYDLGLIRFKGGLPEGFERITFLPESRKNWLAPGAPVLGVGFGFTNPESKDGGILRFTQLEVDRWYDQSEISVHDPNGVSNLCSGDSGSPGYVLVNRKLYFWGIAYAVTRNCGGDGKAFYSTHYGHMQWLVEAVAKMRQL